MDKAKQWYLDLFAYIIGLIALWFFVDDTLVRAIESVMMVERAGTAWNSPQPLLLKTMLVIGAMIYLAQLLVNLYRHFDSKIAKNIIAGISAFIIFRLILVFFEQAFELKGVIAINEHLSSIAAYIEPTRYFDIREMTIAQASMLIVGLMVHCWIDC